MHRTSEALGHVHRGNYVEALKEFDKLLETNNKDYLVLQQKGNKIQTHNSIDKV